MKFFILVTAIFLLYVTSLISHGGRLNSEGCHNNRKTGGYHCHSGGSSGSSSPSRSSSSLGSSSPSRSSSSLGSSSSSRSSSSSGSGSSSGSSSLSASRSSSGSSSISASGNFAWKQLTRESSSNDKFCKSIGGKRNIILYYDSNGLTESVTADCETNKYIIKGSLDKKRSLNSIQQAVFFSVLTKKKPMVVIYNTDGVNGKYETQVKAVAEKLGIKFLIQ